MSFLLAGGGACIAWVISHLTGDNPDAPLAIAVIVMGLWLFALAAGVLFRCLAFAPASPPANQPLNVYLPNFDTLGIREINLQYLESAILHSIATGQRKTKALVKIRLAACITPLVFLAAWALASGCFQ